MAAGRSWPTIANNEMLTYADVNRAINEGYLNPGPEAPPSYVNNMLISVEVMAAWVSNTITGNKSQIVAKGAVGR